MEAQADFDEYVAARWAVLVRSAIFLGCSHADAEDLVQTVLMRCHRSWGKVSSSRDPDAYVYRALVNCLATSRRRRWWGEQLSLRSQPDVASSDDVAETVTTSHMLRSALREMSADQRAVIVLRFYSDLPEQRVAEILGLPVGTVKSRTARALAQLHRRLEEPAPLTERVSEL